MVVQVLEVIEAALALPQADRETVVRRLVDSLGHDDGVGDKAVAAAWDAVISSRVDDIVSGKVEGIPWEQVDAELDQILAEFN